VSKLVWRQAKSNDINAQRRNLGEINNDIFAAGGVKT